jgi:hypothetical protein
MGQRLLRRQLDSSLAGKLNKLQVTRPPLNYQLGRLRELVQNALLDKDLSKLKSAIRDIHDSKKASDQFRNARVDGFRLINWLADRVEKPYQVFAYLKDEKLPKDESSLQKKALRVAGADVALTAEMAMEYTLRLVLGLIKQTMRMGGN